MKENLIKYLRTPFSLIFSPRGGGHLLETLPVRFVEAWSETTEITGVIVVLAIELGRWLLKYQV